MLEVFVWILIGPFLIACGYLVSWYVNTRPRKVPMTELDLWVCAYCIAVVAFVAFLVVLEYG